MARTYTVKDAAKILGYSTNSIYSFLKENRINGVRVGKGRFRISEEEMGRLLNITKPGQYLTPSSKQASHERIQQNSPIESITQHQNISDFVSGQSLSDVRVGVPSLQDWSIGLTAVIFGISMMLFGSTLEEFSMNGSLLAIPIRVAFFAGGVGLLLSDIVNKSRHLWHQVFHGILSLGFFACAGVMGLAGDFGSTVFFGALGSGIILPIVFGFGGVGSFVLTLGLILLSIPFGFLRPLVSRVGEYFVLDQEELRMVSMSLSIFSVLLTGALWWSAISLRRFYGLILRISGTFLFVLSYLFAGELLWGRAFVLLLIGLLAWYAPIWLTFRFEHFRDRKLVFQSFIGILLLFLGALFILKFVQGGIASYAKKEDSDKVQYGR